MEKIKIDLGNHTVVLTFSPFDEEIDIDDLCKIHYDNLSGEVITIAVLLNRIGLLKAEAENAVSKNKHFLEVMASKKRKHFRKIAFEKKIKKTVQQIEDDILLDDEYHIEKISYLEDKRIFSIIESLYWAINAKDKKLSVLMVGVTPEDFEHEIIEGKINGVMIRKVENLIK